MARINAACKKLARLCCKSSAATSLALSMVVSLAIAQPTAEALERSRQELGVFLIFCQWVSVLMSQAGFLA